MREALMTDASNKISAVRNSSEAIAPPPDKSSTETVEARVNAGSVFCDLASLRLSEADTASLTGTRELLSHVPVRKPGPHEFFRVHPDPKMSLTTTVFVDKQERETFFVEPKMRGALIGETKPALLTTAVTTQGVVLIFPVYLPIDGRTYPWWEAAREAAELAKTNWIRMVADMRLGAYRIYKAEGELPEPDWPEQSFAELLDIAFRDRIIGRMDHPVVRRLRGLS
jgi:hypothetical protein